MRQEVQAPGLPASCLWILRYIYARLELVGVGTEYARCVSLNFEPMCMNTRNDVRQNPHDTSPCAATGCAIHRSVSVIVSDRLRETIHCAAKSE